MQQTPKEWNKYDSVLVKALSVNNTKLSKILKHGKQNILNNPSILFNKKNITVKVHFDMYHGYGNLDKAINLIKKKDREEFRRYVKINNTFNPHIMCVAKPKILKLWFNDLFLWLKKCEVVFGFKDLKGYDTTRLYAYLAERYHSYWFKKYSNYVEWPYKFIDTEKN